MIPILIKMNLLIIVILSKYANYKRKINKKKKERKEDHMCVVVMECKILQLN